MARISSGLNWTPSSASIGKRMKETKLTSRTGHSTRSADLEMLSTFPDDVPSSLGHRWDTIHQYRELRFCPAAQRFRRRFSCPEVAMTACLADYRSAHFAKLLTYISTLEQAWSRRQPLIDGSLVSALSRSQYVRRQPTLFLPESRATLISA